MIIFPLEQSINSLINDLILIEDFKKKYMIKHPGLQAVGYQHDILECESLSCSALSVVPSLHQQDCI